MGGFRLIPADKMILADAMRANIGRIPFMASHPLDCVFLILIPLHVDMTPTVSNSKTPTTTKRRPHMAAAGPMRAPGTGREVEVVTGGARLPRSPTWSLWTCPTTRSCTTRCPCLRPSVAS